MMNTRGKDSKMKVCAKRILICLLTIGLIGMQQNNSIYAAENQNEVLQEKAQTVRRALILGETASPQVPLLDVTSMTKMMKQCTFSGKKMGSIVKYNDRTKKDIKKKIISVFANAEKQDVSYIYITCHGDSDGNIYLGSDGTYFSPKELRNLLDENVQGKVVLMIDACFSGNAIKKSSVSDKVEQFDEAFIANFTKTVATKSGELASSRYRVLCSSSKKEESLGGDLSLATKYWELGAGWNALNSKETALKADKNGDKKVTLEELYNYSYKKVLQESAKTGEIKQHVQVYPQSVKTILFGRY